MSFSPERKPYVPPAVKETLSIKPELKGRGVFFDTREALRKNGELADVVLKEFHLDLLFSKKAAVDLFSKQEEELETMKPFFPKEMLPESVFVVPDEFKADYEWAKVNTDNIYPYSTFAKIQLNRRMQGRYGLDERFKDREKSFGNRALMAAGNLMDKWANMERRPVGFLVQERIHGTSFGKLFQTPDWKKQPNYPKLRDSVRTLIEGLRNFHADVDRAAFTWHALESDNVTVELDENGEITGRVVIIDTNYSQRPDKTYAKSVTSKLEKKILQPLAVQFGLEG